jgi:hypothetical protein
MYTLFDTKALCLLFLSYINFLIDHPMNIPTKVGSN